MTRLKIFVRSFCFTYAQFKALCEDLQSPRNILMICQKSVWLQSSSPEGQILRNMKFTSSTFIFKGGLLGNKWFCRALADSTESTRLYRLCFILPTVQVVCTDGYSFAVSTVTLPIVLGSTAY